MSPEAAVRELAAALKDQNRFEALAPAHLDTDRLVALQVAENAAPGMAAALETFMLRAVTDTDSHETLNERDEIIFYDLDGRQVVVEYFKIRSGRYLLVAVVRPDQTYKQVLKRLAKTLKPLL